MFRVIFKRSSPIGLLLTAVLVMLGVRAFRRATGEMYRQKAKREREHQAFVAELDARSAAVWSEIEARRVARERAVAESGRSAREMGENIRDIANMLNIDIDAPELVSHEL